MKKILALSVILAGLSFGLMSCEDDDDDNNTDPCADVTCPAGEVCEDGACVPDATSCTICGEYDGTIDSDSLRVQFPPAADIDTTLSGYPATAELATTAFTDSLALTVNLTLSGTPITVTVNGFYDDSNTITVTDKVYNYLGAVPILVNGTGTITGTTMDADIVLDDPTGSTGDNIYAEVGFTGDLQ